VLAVSAAALPGLIAIVVVGAFAGAAIGSFAAVVSSRGLRNSLGGRSQCDSCGRALTWYELVPLVSYPALRGRCRTCGARIALPVYGWELAGAALALIAATTVLLVANR
jgi:leader peptidase (prepilin peptidase)/N-methyltransferase